MTRWSARRVVGGARRRIYDLFRPTRPCIRQVEYDGARLIVPADQDVGWYLVRDKRWEEKERRCLARLIERGDTCLDVGAHVGIYSLMMARLAAEGRVVAFEPVPLNRDMLRVNLTLNGVTNVSLEDCILADASGTKRFSISKDTAFSSLVPTQRKEHDRFIEVRVETLDRLFAERGLRADIIKIDTEGAELPILRGGRRLLSTPELRPRALLVELNPQNQRCYGYQPEEVVAYMQGFGYKAYSIMDKAVRPGWPHEGAIEDVLFCDPERAAP